ncbi:putative secreted protein [Cryptosporidium canis]|uniref:Secreted protein n=1 Tax=Cryptosporidium canis TaxID=195482 RepID=A0A9D5HZX3_9CRYT|nr:putative secreted protein [Cryptosporidium canis]
MSSIHSKTIIKTFILLLILLFLRSNTHSVSSQPKKQKRCTKLSKLFSRRSRKYSLHSKDGSVLFPALEAISDKNTPILKSVKHFDSEYDEDILGRNKVYIIKNGEVPGWEGMKIPIHTYTEESILRLKPPKETLSISIFPPVVAERFMLFALEECLLPSKFFLQVAFCTFDAIYPFLEGVPSGEIMQDITGAAMYSVNKVEDELTFNLDYCRKAISMIPDERINSNTDSKCHNISLCIHQNLLPQLSSSLSALSWDQLIEKSFELHQLEYQLRMNESLESILWKIIKFTHKSKKWKRYKNPNKLFTIIRAYILTLYVRHSSTIIPGWHTHKYPSAKNSLSFVYVKGEAYTTQSAYVKYCAKKLRIWLGVHQPITSNIIPNVATKDEVSSSACFYAGRAGFVSSDKFDFTNMIEDGTENVDLLNLQLPIVLLKSEREIQYIRNNNLRRAKENRWSSYHESCPYSLNHESLPPKIKDEKQNLQSLTIEANIEQESHHGCQLMDEIHDLIKKKRSGKLNNHLETQTFENKLIKEGTSSSKKESWAPSVKSDYQASSIVPDRDSNINNYRFLKSESKHDSFVLRDHVKECTGDNTNSVVNEDEGEYSPDEEDEEDEEDEDDDD